MSNEDTVIITGAASGIGRAAAEISLKSGTSVISLDLSEKHWEHEGLKHIKVDLANENAVTAAFNDLLPQVANKNTTLIHSAGIYRHKPLKEMQLSEWEKTLSINLSSSFLVSREASKLPGLTAITLLTSVAYARGDEGEPGAHYAASKGGVVSLTRQLSAELGASGIRVNCVAPGVIDTPMTTITDDPEATEHLIGRLPIRRLGYASEVAEACIFLNSEKASYITGVVLPVDGGYLIS